MPHLFSDTDEKRTQAARDGDTTQDKENMWGRTWKQMGNWLKKEDENEPPPAADGTEQLNEKVPCQDIPPTRPSHTVISDMPRPISFKRQDSEQRERLYPHQPDHEERRATSADRRLGTSYEQKLSPGLRPQLAFSPQKAHMIDSANGSERAAQSEHDFASTAGVAGGQHSDRHDQDIDVHSQFEWSHHNSLQHPDQLSEALDELQIQSELEAKWILNLSMHFRDHSEREKFFITYAEEPNNWRRVTVSCDYRHAPHDSLEADLKSLHYQRDKSAHIYEAIRDSLPQIQFYPTVTNLKLETSDGRLHVRVTEDVNEIIHYPSVSAVAHLELPEYSERSIEFDCHMSGFVYKVKANGRCLIKKEIPGPEAVEEFLYEINALSSLRGSANVVQLEGIVVDDRDHIKGILLNYCDQGALVDLIYDFRYTDCLTWERRVRWAKQIVHGLAEIHEAGFVQGDFTLSNIVIDHNDDAQIIDINRRGCPIGWEPPELSSLIQAGQRISIYIGVKSDIFQLGMVLWALAEQQDEPERQERPLKFQDPETVPQWYRDIVEICLSLKPKERLLAKELLARFPEQEPNGTGPQPTISVNDIKVEDAKQIDGGDAASSLSSVEMHWHNASPVNGSAFADIETDVEYLVVSSDSEKPHVPTSQLSAQDDVDGPRNVEHVLNFEDTPEASKGGAISNVEQDAQPMQPVEEKPSSPAAEEPQTNVSVGSSAEEGKSSASADQPPTIIASTEAPAGAKDQFNTSQQPAEHPLPDRNLTEDLGNPPLAKLSPPPQAQPVKPDTSPSRDLDGPHLTTLPPLLPITATHLEQKPSLGPPEDLDSPPLATHSLPSAADTLSTQPEPIQPNVSLSVDIGSPPLATLSSPPPAVTPNPPPAIGLDPLPEPGNSAATESGHVQTSHEPELVNTLELEIPKHQDPTPQQETCSAPATDHDPGTHEPEGTEKLGLETPRP